MPILAADYPFLDIFWTMLVFFAWAIWFWTLVVVLTDVFGRTDLSGWAKAGWTLFTIVLPFIGLLTYLIAHGTEMGERRTRDARVRSTPDTPAAGPAPDGVAAQIAEAKRLLDAGAIDEAEFAQIKRKVLH